MSTDCFLAHTIANRISGNVASVVLARKVSKLIFLQDLLHRVVKHDLEVSKRPTLFISNLLARLILGPNKPVQVMFDISPRVSIGDNLPDLVEHL